MLGVARLQRDWIRHFLSPIILFTGMGHSEMVVVGVQEASGPFDRVELSKRV